ncbi:MAG: hypothetical protein HY722_13325 [Planctomycetes bacterium]|nr:hypothetical protein [Planctomycetota bacterium]
MRHRPFLTAFLLPLAAACSGPRQPADAAAVPATPADRAAWGTARGGLRTRLSLQDEGWAPGRPLRVRLELENVGTRTTTYDDQQVGVNDPFAVTGPDGRTVPWVGGSVQTLGHPKSIAPGERVILRDGLDLAAGYLMNAAGPYVVCFRGGDGFGETAIPPSNEVRLTAGAGEVSPERALLDRIRERIPEGWELSCQREEAPGGAAGLAIHCSWVPPSHRKKDVVQVGLWIAQEGSDAGEAGDLLGQTDLGRAWLVSGPGAEGRWPGHRGDLEAALGL